MKKAAILMGLSALMMVSLSAFGADPNEDMEKAAKELEGMKPKSPTTKKSAFTNSTDQLSYAIGMNIGTNINAGIKSGEIKINLDVLFKAMRDVVEDRPVSMTQDEVKETFMNLQKEMMAKQEERGKKNLQEAEKYLAENAKKPGVKTTKSGLQYVIEKEGAGAMPKPTDRVKVNYKGTLLDGKEFDSSYKRGQPLEIPVNGVIPGWSEAMQMMKVGSKWKLFIPPSLGYGKGGMGANIPPNSMLIFEVELLGTEKASTQPGPGMGMRGMPGGMPRMPRPNAPRTPNAPPKPGK